MILARGGEVSGVGRAVGGWGSTSANHCGGRVPCNGGRRINLGWTTLGYLEALAGGKGADPTAGRIPLTLMVPPGAPVMCPPTSSQHAVSYPTKFGGFGFAATWFVSPPTTRLEGMSLFQRHLMGKCRQRCERATPGCVSDPSNLLSGSIARLASRFPFSAVTSWPKARALKVAAIVRHSILVIRKLGTFRGDRRHLEQEIGAISNSSN